MSAAPTIQAISSKSSGGSSKVKDAQGTGGQNTSKHGDSAADSLNNRKDSARAPVSTGSGGGSGKLRAHGAGAGDAVGSSCPFAALHAAMEGEAAPHPVADMADVASLSSTSGLKRPANVARQESYRDSHKDMSASVSFQRLSCPDSTHNDEYVDLNSC